MLLGRKLCLWCILLVMVSLAAFSLPLQRACAVSGTTIIEYSIGPIEKDSPTDICAGPDGALWFTKPNDNKIGRITTSGAITEYSIGPNAGSSPAYIVAGPDGALWFTEPEGDRIGRITTSGAITEYSIGLTAKGAPVFITVGPDGALWFTEILGNRIGRITTSGAITEYGAGLTANSGPLDIAAGPDGALWFTEAAGDKIGRITTSGAITELDVPTADSWPYGICAGPDGALWFTEAAGDRIGRITTSGAITEPGILAAGSAPIGIAAGPDGALWFTEHDGNRIGRITTSGAITELGVPTADSWPMNITAGPDGNLWFTEYNGHKIGRTVTFSADASVSSGHGTVSPASQNVIAGGTATVRITPDAGYRIASVTDNGAPVTVTNPYVINNVTANHDVVVTFAPEGKYKFYFAEGYTGQDAFFEYLCLMNPGTSATTAYITYIFSDGSTRGQDVPIGKTSRATVNVNDIVGPDRNVSVKMSCDAPIVAERPMYFNYGGAWTGGHDVIGASSPQSTFYFAEGTTWAGQFDEWLCLMNPGTTETTAHITYMFPDSTTQPQDVKIGATTRTTVKVNDQVGPNRDVSIKIQADAPIVAERPMYFNYGGLWTGGHDVVGISAPQSTFYFAEGTTWAGQFDEWLCLMNPEATPTTAHITYMFPDGTTQLKDVKIGATTRTTVKVNDQVGPNRDVSIKIQADAPIVAERPMYFNYGGLWTGGHDVIGAPSPQSTFYFAEGTTWAGQFDEWLCLMNPGTSETIAHITYMFPDGTTQLKDVKIGATTRTTVKVNDQVGPDKDVSIKIQADAPIVAERPMYFNYGGAWTGGHDVVGYTP